MRAKIIFSVIIAYYHIGIGFFCFLDQFFQHCRIYPVIRIYMNEVFAGRILQPLLSGLTYTSICLVNYLKSAIFFRIIITDFTAFVRAAVINQYHFKIGI